MAILGCSAVLPCRPRPTSFLGILAFLSCWGCLRACFSQVCDGGAGAGGGGGAGSGDEGDAGAQHVPNTKVTNNQAGAKQIHSSDNKNDDIQQLKHGMTEIWGFLASMEKHLDKIVNHIPSAAPVVSSVTEIRGSLASMEKHLYTIVNHIPSSAPMVTGMTGIRGSLASMEKHVETILEYIRSAAPMMTGMTGIWGSLASMEKHLETILNHIRSAAPMVTGTTENKDVVNRTKGLLGSMYSIADKLPMICVSAFILLMANLSATKSPAPEARQNFDDPWMQVIIVGSLILCFLCFILLSLTSKFKERESIDGALFKIAISLLLLVFLTLWSGLCMILHFFAHTSKFVVWPLGISFWILSVLYWYFEFYKEWKQIMEELKKDRVLENGIPPENREAEPAMVIERADSYTVQILNPSVYALSKGNVELTLQRRLEGTGELIVDTNFPQ